MGRGKAYRRNKTETRKTRARAVLKRLGFNDHMDRRAGRFADSRMGCNCCLCKNPRRLYKGKKSGSLTLKEYHDRLEQDDE